MASLSSNLLGRDVPVKLWSEREDDLLKELYVGEKLTMREVGDRLGRSQSSISYRTIKLGLQKTLTCYRCGQPIEHGEDVVRRMRKHRYHESCWESLFVDV